MKYIKTFERNIKSTDSRIIPILRYFSDNIVNIVNAFDKFNTIIAPTSIKRFFTDTPHPGEGIKIYYSGGIRLIEIKLEYRKSWNREIENIIFKIRITPIIRQNIKKEFEDFQNFFIEKLKKYKDNNTYNKLFDQIDFIIPVNEIDLVIDELNEYYMYVDAKNFNL